MGRKPYHPCLLMTAERLASVRALGHPLQREMYEDLLAIDPQGTYTPHVLENPVMPSLGNQVAFEAIRYLVTSCVDYARRACAALERYIAGEQPGTGQFDYDALGMIYASMAYDCLYDYLDRTEQRPFREWLLARFRRSMELVYDDAARQRPNCNNHYTRRLMALAGAAFAFRGELAGAERWMRRGLEKLDAILAGAAQDGSDPYGGTWLATHPLHPLYAALFFANNGIDRFASSGYLRGLARFRWYAALGKGDEAITLSGNSHALYVRNDAAEFYILAAQYRDPLAQWMGHRARALSRDPDHQDAVRPFYEFYELDPALSLLLFDPSLPASDPAEYHLPSAWFQDTGWVILRDNWRSDSPVAALRCAPPGGIHRHPDADPDFWHSQPSANELFLYCDGQYLLNGAGPVNIKSTALCNTLTVDGFGQYPAGGPWPPNAAAIANFACAGDYDCAAGEAGNAYPPEHGLTRFRRTVMLVRPDLLVVTDHCATTRRVTLALLFHSYGRWLPLDRQYIVESSGCKAVVQFFPQDVRTRIGPTFGEAGYSSFCQPVEHLVAEHEAEGESVVSSVWSLCGGAAPVTAPPVTGEPGRLWVWGAQSEHRILVQAEAGVCTMGSVRALARVCCAERMAEGNLRRLFVEHGEWVEIDGVRVVNFSAGLRSLALFQRGDWVDLDTDSPVEQQGTLRIPMADELPVELPLVIHAGKDRQRLVLPRPICRKPLLLADDLALSVLEGSLEVSETTLRPGHELLLYTPPGNDRPATMEVVRLGRVEGGRAWLASPLFQPAARYTVAAGAALSWNLVPNGDFGHSQPGWWATWPGAPIAVCEIHGGTGLYLKSGEAEGVVYQLIAGLERARWYELALTCTVVAGRSTLEYHDPRGPDRLAIHGAPGCRQRLFTRLRFMLPAHGRPWKGGHRNRPECMVAFRLAPRSELIVHLVTMHRL